MATGYSGTPLSKKLGIKEGFSILLVNQPSHYFELFTDFPDDVTILKAAKFESADFAHLFCTSLKELTTLANNCKNSLKKNASLWISWPKGSSKIETDLKREPIREYLLSIGLVDVKVAAIDEDWSGLKFVYRLKDRK
ncbi:DUF3052 domain-containing protein [Flagellimonas aquimarina]|uniref:DUF3052 domain-containing protein n=1 Tax=Flagellimonas aquimarina TaxID=2201895 RepID=A0A316L079_9FLAO|nr:DUF3052 domain-containing protein [Allomuricauda koreensis]PWL39241.1 DUF3052 domain-containing protein [Allomuricauda koreensis]